MEWSLNRFYTNTTGMKRILLFVRTFVCLAFVLIACNNKEAKIASVIYYYPKANMYYKVAEKSYIYSLDGGRTWLNITDTADKAPMTLGAKVLLTSTTDSIWKENEVHRKLYAGTLYNLTGKDTAKVIAITKVTERKAVRKSSKPKAKKVEEKETKRKKPIKKFFQKIFGKRKDR
jgi:hypothetical protein